MHPDNLERSIEAILFASGEAVEVEKLCQVLELDEKTVKHLVGRIRDRYEQQHSPLDIVALGSAFQMCTRPEYAPVIRRVLELRRGAALSPAALEVLAVIAYNQPVTRAFVEQVRGVDCSSIVRSLVEKALIEEAGRLPVPGKPIAYRTTANFLRCFGLSSLEDLPTLPDHIPADGEQTAQPPDRQMEFDALANAE